MRALSFFLSLLAMAAPAPGVLAQAQDLKPVSGFEVKRYLGLWREIASIPAWFQEDCVAGTTAEYGLTEDGQRLTVLNSCETASGNRKKAEGRARFTGPRDQGGLEVTFVDILGWWFWPAAGAYVILELDPDYRWVAIGHPSRDYAWILARDETLPPEIIKRLAGVFEAAGYDSCRILTSPRRPDEARVPLCKF